MMEAPLALKRFFSTFPLRTTEPVPTHRTVVDEPTIWIVPPNASDSVLSAEVECLKWQAYLALRGFTNVAVRYDIEQQGAIDGRLPNLHIPSTDSAVSAMTDASKVTDGFSQLFSAQYIPLWVDAKLGQSSLDDPLEGYKDEAARDESRAWVSLLEGNVHAALIAAQPPPNLFISLLGFSHKEGSSIPEQLSAVINPPPPSNILSMMLPSTSRVSPKLILSKYTEAVRALSERLSTDKWFLGSASPTPLDALLFAYLHRLLLSKDGVRSHITRHVNLVAWELRVRAIVQGAFAKGR